MTNYKSNQLTIDTEKPKVRLDGIKNESANNQNVIGFKITASDTNFDTSKFNPTLTAVVMNDNGSFSELTIPNGDLTAISAGKEYSYTINIPNNVKYEGIYTLSCEVTDMSGNVFDDMLVSDSDNKEMKEVKFSVNRKGSTFMPDDNTTKLIETYYVQKVQSDVVFIETNADPLRSYKVTMNGNELKENTDYTVTKSGGDGKWNKYTYNINKFLFEKEGSYKVVVSSKDKAGNDAYSDIKNAEVNFVVDRTAPILTISGLQDGGRYQVETQTVTIIPTDDGGKIYSIKVAITDSNGSEISVPIELTSEELLNKLDENNGRLTFEIPSGYNQGVQIQCVDYAKNSTSNTENPYHYGNVTVSTNGLVIFYADKLLFFGSIGTVVLLAGALWFFIILKRKKKKEGKAE